MLLLGFGNKARNGKDTAAEAIKAHFTRQNDLKRSHEYGRPVTVGIFKYATALYQEVNDYLSIANNLGYTVPELLKMGVRDIVGGDLSVISIPDWVQAEPNAQISDLAPYGKHPKLLQWWGTEYRRAHFGQDYWIKKLFATMPTNLDIAMVTDVRFVDEAVAITERGGYTINVQRLDENGNQYFDPSRPATHRSETDLDQYNWNFYIKTPHGHAALTGEQAITLAEYLRGLQSEKTTKAI